MDYGQIIVMEPLMPTVIQAEIMVALPPSSTPLGKQICYPI